MFEEREILEELNRRLSAAGFDPADPSVEKLRGIISGFFAEKTAEVLAKVREVLNMVDKGSLN